MVVTDSITIRTQMSLPLVILRDDVCGGVPSFLRRSFAFLNGCVPYAVKVYKGLQKMEVGKGDGVKR